MDYLIISLAALAASALTLISGFGLGTLLMPVFAIFFPLELAIALSAIVHFLNNIFKFALLGRYTDRTVLLRFGVPAILAAFAGAALLVWISDLAPLFSWSIGLQRWEVKPVSLLIALIMLLFAALEYKPSLGQGRFKRKHLLVGGVLSGFFGGLSGHQGALRSAFLLHAGLSKESFIATGITIACLVDVTRLGLYASHVNADAIGEQLPLLVTATLAAFLGAFAGSRLMTKITLRAVQRIVAGMLVVIALLLGTGLI